MEKNTDMKRIDLILKEHGIKVGQKCGDIEPNITEDCIFYENDIPIGFYIKDISKHSEKAAKLAELADQEFRSKNVPKSILDRMETVQHSKNGMKRSEARKIGVSQMSTILGGVPPKPVMRRPYATISSVHSVKSANTFIKAMLMLANESEKIIKEICPNIWETQNEIFQKHVDKKWRFGNMWTSSISNYNIAAPFHKDTGNIEGCVNVIIAKKKNATGGNTTVPDYGATMDSCDNSMLVYPAWRNVHGVTPIIPTHEGGYRNSLVFYPLKAFKGLK
jgi:hypothetical protein